MKVVRSGIARIPYILPNGNAGNRGQLIEALLALILGEPNYKATSSAPFDVESDLPTLGIDVKTGAASLCEPMRLECVRDGRVLKAETREDRVALQVAEFKRRSAAERFIFGGIENDEVLRFIYLTPEQFARFVTERWAMECEKYLYKLRAPKPDKDNDTFNYLLKLVGA